MTLGFFIYKGLLKSLVFKTEKHYSKKFPKVSVIVAVRNESENIPHLLESLKKQDYHDYDIIIVDDYSTDNTLELLEKYTQNKHNIKIIQVKENKYQWGPKKNALHIGILEAEGEIILTTDADCRPEAGWITAMSRKIVQGAGIVVGFSPLICENTLIGRLKSLEALAAGIVSAGLIGINRPYMAVGRSFGYLRKLYLQKGGFGKSGIIPSGDDDLLLHRLSGSAKVEFVNAPLSKVISFDNSSDYVSKKRRHFSVTPIFPPVFIAMGVMVFLYILMIVLLLFISLATGKLSIQYFLICFLIKIIIDCLILNHGAKLLNEKYNAFDFILAEFMQFPYTLILQPLSLIGSVKWRGRTL